MQSPNKFMLTTLAFILLFIGSAQIVSAQEVDFEVDGSVMYSHSPDDTYVTVLGVSIRNFTGGTLPDDIDDVVFEGPSGVIASMGDPGVEFDQPDNSYYFVVSGQPELGTYTFTVTSTAATGSIERTDTDIQTVIREIPLPDETSFSPAPGAVVSSITPIFSWDPVSYGDVPLYYRLQVQDAAGNMESTPRTRDMTSFVVPPGYLQPGQSYSWRVRVTDADGWVTTENRSQSAWQPFTSAATLDHPAMPVVDLDYSGAYTFNRSTGTIIELSVKVIDHDGIVFNYLTGIPSHTVTASHPSMGTVNLNFDYSESDNTAYFYTNINPGTAPLAPYAGDWTFTVIDPAGNTASTVDNLTVAPLPYPDEGTFLPADGASVTDTTPTFTWDAPTGTNADRIVRYRVRIYTDDLSQTVWRGYVTETTYTVPPGVLAPGTSYRYRIDVYDAHSSLDIDNFSRAPADSANYLRFTTGSESPDPYIDLDSNGVHTWNGGSFGPSLEFWVRVFDPQGVPGNIASVKAILPGGSEVPLRYEYNEGANSAYYASSTFDPLTSGTYTLRVEDREGNTYETFEDLDNSPIGYPAEISLSPVRSTLVGSTAVDFDWEDVSGVAFYRVEIYDENFNRIHYFYATDSQFSLPAGYLEEGSYYAYRITTRREFWDENVDHGSSSPRSRDEYFNFITTAAAGSTAPTIETDNWGALLWHNPRPDDPATPNYWRAFSVRVTDADGPPHCIQKVEVEFPNGTTRILGYDGNTSPDSAYYWFKDDIANPADMPEGTYTFTVTDVDGNSASTTDDFTRNVIEQPTHLLPLPDSEVPGTTPTISWNPVPGAATYRVEIYNEAGNRIHRPYLNGTSYSVPEGVLELNQTYSYRIRAHREDDSVENMNNMSSSMWWDNLRPHFTTTDVADSDNDGIPDTIENATGCLLANDADTDDDGIPDGVEDANRDGIVDAGETSPCLVDTDGDGIQDGTESGLTTGDPDTDPAVFIPDADPSTTTDPLLADTDGDGILDGVEDFDQNGRVDPGEGDPNVKESKAMPWIPLLLLDD